MSKFRIENPLIGGVSKFQMVARVGGKIKRLTLKSTLRGDAEIEANDVWPIQKRKWMTDRVVDAATELAVGTETLLGRWIEECLVANGSHRRAKAAILMLGGSHRNIGGIEIEILRDALLRRMSAGTTVRYLKSLRAFLRWLNSKGAIRRVPRFVFPKATSRARGRPLTDEEVAKMRKEFAMLFKAASKRDEWLRFFDAMLLSGLRISEAFELRWGESKDSTGIVMQGDMPCFSTPECADKAGIRRIWPMTRECWEVLSKGRDPKRSAGKVFRLFGKRNGSGEVDLRTASRYVAAAGEIAGVIVRDRPERTATAHELRRTFCSRIVRLVGLTVVEQMALMRHRNLATTQKYYLGADASELGRKLWSSGPQSTSVLN